MVFVNTPVFVGISVPDNFSSVLKSYTQHGYIVLGLAWKQLPSKYNYVKVQRIYRYSEYLNVPIKTASFDPMFVSMLCYVSYNNLPFILRFFPELVTSTTGLIVLTIASRS